MSYKKIQEATNIQGKKILVRVDFNVPIKDGCVVDDYRIRKTLPTIEFLQKAGAKIILISHIESGNTLRPVFEHLKKTMQLSFCEDCLDDSTAIKSMNEGDVVLCENIRLYSGEKTNDIDFAKQLASLADVYVNEAFSVSHRKHASVCRITEFLPSCAGLHFDEEVKHLGMAFNPDRPFLFILGGAKFETKLPLIAKFNSIADTIFVGGALAHNFFKEQGLEIGQSLVAEGNFHLTDLLKDGKIILPVDVIAKRGDTKIVIKVTEGMAGDFMPEDGPETLLMLKKYIASAKFILWNGPLGNYENGFKRATLDLATVLAESDAKTIVGGGDTLAAIAELNLENKFTFVSAAGGAMLDFLANGTLSGIEALENSK